MFSFLLFSIVFHVCSLEGVVCLPAWGVSLLQACGRNVYRVREKHSACPRSLFPALQPQPQSQGTRAACALCICA